MTRERFIELATAEQEALRRFLLALCGGNRAEVEDMAQDTLVKAYMASGGYVERYKFRTWLFRIGYRTFLDNRKRQRPQPMPDGVDIQSASASDDAFRYEELYAAIRQLPEKTRAAVLLYHFDGYSVREIAQITRSNPVAVRQHLSRGLRALRRLLEGEK